MTETVSEQVKQILIENRFKLFMADVAKMMDANQQVVEDLLAIEGTTFRKVKRDAQIKLAEKLYGTMSQKELANRLGFTGKTPHVSLYEWRHRNKLEKFSNSRRSSYE